MTNQTLESFVNSIQNLYQQFQTTNKQLNSSQVSSETLINNDLNFNEIYNNIYSNLNIFIENAAIIMDNLLPIFTLPEYTLPNMAILYAVLTSSKQDSEAVDIASSHILSAANQDKLFNEVENCIQFSDQKQIEVATNIYEELCHFYTQKLTLLNKSKRGLSILRNAIKKIQYDSNIGIVKANYLTTVHADVLQLSLASENFSIALKLLSKEILDIHKPHSGHFDSKFLLSYFYYGGCIYAAMKQFELALFYFEQALTTPALVLSQIMIESYKKFILISLISKGKLPLLPKYTSRIVINQIKPICSIYHNIASSFVSYDQEKLMTLSQKYEDVFQADRNAGLVKQLHKSFYKKNIQKLTKTFITVSLSDLAQKVKLSSTKEAEILMLNMIKDGEIFATINQKDGMVSFQDNPEKYDNPLVMEQLTKHMISCIEIDENIKEMDREITTHPHYIQKCQNNTSSIIDDNTEQILHQASIKRQQFSNAI